MYIFPIKVQTYSSTTDSWTIREFDKEEFRQFAWSQFKLPGQYNLTNVGKWQEAMERHERTGAYTNHVSGTIHYKKYWISERDRVLNGIIIDGFYIPGFYYFYLNYLKIYNKLEKKLTPPTVWDSDYHFFLYVLLSIIEGKHVVVVKTRQRGYSYKISAILYWSYCWFQASINTVGASDESYVQKTWEFIDEYRTFLNTQTAWRRGPQTPKALDWIERTLTEDGNYAGLGSKLKGVTFKQSPTKGVGGAQSFFFYEEAGIAPTLLQTLAYIRPAIEAGNKTTGTIIVSGSVGELEDCEDLKKLFFDPDSYNFLPVKNVWEDDGEYPEVGFFVPDSWSLEGFMDENGNSNVDKAVEFIKTKREKAKQGSKTSMEYQLEVSQTPLTPKEAFDYRKDSYFPKHIVNRWVENLPISKPILTNVELFEKEDSTIGIRLIDDTEGVKPITMFPLKDTHDKRGCVVINEMPDREAPFLTYFAGVDPIATDKTTTSESLFSIYVFKTLTETKYEDEEGKLKTKVSGFRPVAWYTGRMDDIKQTNTIAEYLLRLYNARAVVESNVQNFINHMQNKGLNRLLFTKDEIGFLEDMRFNTQVHKQYGVHMTPNIKSYVLQNIKEYITEEIDHIRKAGTEEVVKILYGVERISDIGLLHEIRQWHEKLNTDRIIAFGLALSIAKHFIINGVFNRKSDIVRKEQEPIQYPSKSFFKTRDGFLNTTKKRSFFKYH